MIVFLLVVPENENNSRWHRTSSFFVSKINSISCLFVDPHLWIFSLRQVWNDEFRLTIAKTMTSESEDSFSSAKFEELTKWSTEKFEMIGIHRWKICSIRFSLDWTPKILFSSDLLSWFSLSMKNNFENF